MIICSECMKEIEEERIVYEDGRIIRYPAYCRKCGEKIYKWKKN